MNSGFRIITVSQLNFYVRSQIDADPMLRNIFLRGEISNFTNHYRSGHFYMSLKDENSVIKAVMFRNSARNLSFMPQNGMKVIAMGRASLYERDGQYQFYIDDMQPDGIGALHVAFEQLKEKLAAEGLFDAARKKNIPAFPERIGVVTSSTGAALHDILNILSRRWPVAQIELYPALVQGDGAAEQLCRAVNYFSRTKSADVVIVGRGGGSIEELWAFNDEKLARCIAACEIPVISAVGHETDFTISDFAADLRAPTPSAAAELVSPDIRDVTAKINSLESELSRGALNKIAECSLRLDRALLSPSLKEPVNAVSAHREKLNSLETRLSDAAVDIISTGKNKLTALSAMVESLSPLKVLSRGYAMASINNRIVTGADELNYGGNFTLTFKDGQARCIAVKKLRETNNGGNFKD